MHSPLILTRAPALRLFARALRLLVLLGALFGCERTTNLVSSGQKDAGFPDGSQLDASQDAGLALCGDKPCECDNGLDDDEDGLPDGFDSECTGPYDDDEASFATGEVPNGNPRCSDCFFDGNPGPDDGCKVPTSCLISGKVANGMGCSDSCMPSDECVRNCEYRTPNGCDCFGCCGVHQAGTVVDVLLADTCSLKSLDKPALCPRCLPSPDCKNDCGRCELCPGRTVADLPADCTETDGIRYTCDEGRVCGDNVFCPDRHYCAQGCCVPVIL